MSRRQVRLWSNNWGIVSLSLYLYSYNFLLCII